MDCCATEKTTLLKRDLIFALHCPSFLIACVPRTMIYCRTRIRGGPVMLASNVLAEEVKYHNRWLASQEAKPAKQGAVDVFDYKPIGRSDYYYNAETPKSLIVLHHTAGWFWGDIDTLTTPHYHVSVSFVVARSGWIYRLFNRQRGQRQTLDRN
jgi:hypothetical protein